MGWYEDWCLSEHERLQNMYLKMLDKLMGYCEAHGQVNSGLAYGEQVLRYDRASERTYQRMMRLYAGGTAVWPYGNTSGAWQRSRKSWASSLQCPRSLCTSRFAVVSYPVRQSLPSQYIHTTPPSISCLSAYRSFEHAPRRDPQVGFR